MRMSVSTEEVSGGPGPVGGGGGHNGGGLSSRSGSLTPSTSTSTGMSTMVTMSTPLTTIQQQQSQKSDLSQGQSDVVKTAYRRKLKGKKKFFVLRRETEAGPARLEYHTNERKFKLGHPPKKSIVLKACFNISRTDAKCKWAVALHTHNDCVRIAMNSEEEMTEWLRIMNTLIGDEDESDDMMPMPTTTITTGTTMSPTTMSLVGGAKPHFEHVWLVTALNKGLGSKENILGPYRLCLTSKELTLLKLKVGDHEEKNAVLKFPLNVIRNVSHDATFGCFFHIEFGRLAPTGPGQLSLKTEDNNIAQNMHLLILKAMQNYSKEDLLPRDGNRRGRSRTYTWSDSVTRSGSYSQGTPPIMSRINSMDSSGRIRTESMGSSESRGGGSGTGMSPPMPIHTPPSIYFNSPMCSTTDSASSSYSVDYENNNGHQNRILSTSNQTESSGLGMYSKSQENDDESYVPWNPTPGEEPPLTISPNLSLPLTSFDTTDYVETTIGHNRSGDTHSTTTTIGSAVATPSSYMEMQSPSSPFDDYMSMSPGAGIVSGSSVKSTGKASSSHSRNSSIMEEHDGYVPMHPGHNSQCGSTAGSIAGLDESYLDMDFSRKLDLSIDDVRRSPTSTESIHTSSSDYPLEKVSSYLLPSDDLDDSSGPRPLRAYSVGSRSDTSANKGRFGKNRLEAVQETFRLRALSVGARNPRAAKPSGMGNHTPGMPTTNSGLPGTGSHYASSVTPSIAPLSSSWSGSTGRWPTLKFPSQNQTSPSSASHSHQNSDTVDSDLMELDFSHNKKGRKRSLPGPGTIGGLSTSSIGSSQSSGSKISPCQKGIAETPETPTESAKAAFMNASPSGYGNYMSPTSSNSGSLKYASSAPISIQKTKTLDGGFTNASDSGMSILTRMTGLDLKQIKQMDDDGAYLDMDFSGANTKSRVGNNGSGNGNGRRGSGPSPSVLPLITRSNSLNGPLSKPTLPVVVVKASENVVPTTFNLQKTTCGLNTNPNYTITDKSATIPCSVLNIPTTSTSTSSTASSPSLSRIEESPEKQDPATTSTTRTNSPQSPARSTTPPGLSAVTYASIDHLRSSPDSSLRKGIRSPVPSDSVMYSQIDFVKSAEVVRNTN